MNKLMPGLIASSAIFSTVPVASAQDDLIDYPRLTMALSYR
jgi:hypothetical protein